MREWLLVQWVCKKERKDTDDKKWLQTKWALWIVPGQALATRLPHNRDQAASEHWRTNDGQSIRATGAPYRLPFPFRRATRMRPEVCFCVVSPEVSVTHARNRRQHAIARTVPRQRFYVLRLRDFCFICVREIADNQSITASQWIVQLQSQS